MNTYTYHSFDVFDTLVTRKVGNPKHIFLKTGELACELEGLKLDPKIFVNERIRAAEDLAQTKRKKNNNIYDIYEQLTKNIGISSELSKRILEIELETEYDNLIPLNNTISKIQQLRKQGSKIIYISDM